MAVELRSKQRPLEKTNAPISHGHVTLKSNTTRDLVRAQDKSPQEGPTLGASQLAEGPDGGGLSGSVPVPTVCRGEPLEETSQGHGAWLLPMDRPERRCTGWIPPVAAGDR